MEVIVSPLLTTHVTLNLLNMPRRKTTSPRVCPECGKHYQATAQNIAKAIKNGRDTYCSTECSYKARGKANRTRFERSCERCGKTFTTTPSHPKHVYCSWACAFPPSTAVCAQCGVTFRFSPSAHARFCSHKCASISEEKATASRDKALKQWRDTRPVMMTALRQRSDTEEWKSAAHFQRGAKHPKWKGGPRTQRMAEMRRYPYRKWRKDVFVRDGHACQICGNKKPGIVAHHLKSWTDFPELCWPCHDRIHGLTPGVRTRACLYCGQRFPLKKSAQKFCSSRCSRRHAVAKKSRELQLPFDA